jgi:hypothetical protein
MNTPSHLPLSNLPNCIGFVKEVMRKMIRLWRLRIFWRRDHSAPAINALAEMAKKAKQTAFLHYITASHASYYKNYERAIAEIDKALALEPKSVRFLAAKGQMMGATVNGPATTKKRSQESVSKASRGTSWQRSRDRWSGGQ